MSNNINSHERDFPSMLWLGRYVCLRKKWCLRLISRIKKKLLAMAGEGAEKVFGADFSYFPKSW